MRSLLLMVMTALALAACPGPGPGPGPQDAGTHVSAALQACATVKEPTRVTTIAHAVTRLNALPPPVTAPCFVASLPRPLDVVATNSVFSAQPAHSRESPRMFLFLPALVASVVPEGEGSEMIEFSQWMTPTRTLKGEVSVPIDTQLSDDAPYTKVHTTFGTTSCGLCHRNEEAHPTIDGGFISDAFRPNSGSLIAVGELKEMHDACGEEDRSPRCELFHALFDFGEVRQGAFSNRVELFIQ